MHTLTRLSITIVCLFTLIACGQQEGAANQQTITNVQMLTVYKTPNCGCCNDWVSHLRDNGFQLELVNQDSVAHVKDLYGIPKTARSCHTAVSDDNFVFEGHVPAKFVSQFLAAPPNGAKGLIVPAMPLGSPGMELDDKFQPYTIFTLHDRGEIKPFAKMSRYDEQF